MGENLLNPRHEVICMLLAHGHTVSKVSQLTGSAPETINSLLTDERFQFEMKALRLKLFGKVTPTKRFEEMVPKAQDVIQEILENPNSGSKPGLKFAAAQEVLDRALGKPKQSVEHSGSLVAALFERLDDEKLAKPVIDVGAHSVEKVDEPAQNVPLDPVDAWAQSNL